MDKSKESALTHFWRRKNDIVEYLDYRVSAKRDCNAPPTRDLNIGLCGQQTDLNVKGVGGKLFLGQSIGIDETNTFQLNLYSTMKFVGAIGIGGKSRRGCVQGYGI